LISRRLGEIVVLIGRLLLGVGSVVVIRNDLIVIEGSPFRFGISEFGFRIEIHGKIRNPQSNIRN
jgi:hypothetical protein